MKGFKRPLTTVRSVSLLEAFEPVCAFNIFNNNSQQSLLGTKQAPTQYQYRFVSNGQKGKRKNEKCLIFRIPDAEMASQLKNNKLK